VAILFCVVVGFLYAAALYMLLSRSVVKLLMGLILLSHATNLLIFSAGRPVRGGVPLVPPGAAAPSQPFPDPLAQAMILTAIVISFGVLAFALVLVYRCHAATGSDDVDELRNTEL